MATIELQQVEKKFADLHAVKPMDLTIDDGEFVVLLGPSGCGKTTTLRMVSGLETVTGGTILLDGRKVTWLHPSERDIAFVFQFFALYPHLTARRNITFPLQAQGESRETIEQRLQEVVDSLEQRVGLALFLRCPLAVLPGEPFPAAVFSNLFRRNDPLVLQPVDRLMVQRVVPGVGANVDVPFLEFALLAPLVDIGPLRSLDAPFLRKPGELGILIQMHRRCPAVRASDLRGPGSLVQFDFSPLKGWD